jgi:hypothetical protein
VFSDPDSLKLDPDKTFGISGSQFKQLLNPQTKVFYDKEHFFKIKTSYMSSITPTRDIEVPGEASRPTENSSNMNFLYFSFCGGTVLACLDPSPDPESGSANTFESGSNPLTKIPRNLLQVNLKTHRLLDCHLYSLLLFLCY